MKTNAIVSLHLLLMGCAGVQSDLTTDKDWFFKTENCFVLKFDESFVRADADPVKLLYLDPIRAEDDIKKEKLKLKDYRGEYNYKFYWEESILNKYTHRDSFLHYMQPSEGRPSDSKSLEMLKTQEILYRDYVDCYCRATLLVWKYGIGEERPQNGMHGKFVVELKSEKLIYQVVFQDSEWKIIGLE
jgi:hypothetical protein